MDLITADGGFDFSIDFNNQEVQIAKLLFAQVCFAITMQKQGGTFILKLFDCFMQHSIDIIYILSSFFQMHYVIVEKIKLAMYVKTLYILYISRNLQNGLYLVL